MKVINGNNIDILKQYPDNHFDSIVTDPPYGLGKEPNANELMKDWIEKGYHEVGGSGFMGKDWDAFVPQPIFWQEIFRVLKPGGHILSFFGTRTYDWGVMAMRFAGFEVRDCIQWLYGSGFPKSHNIGKAIDKMQGNEREIVGTEWEGWGSALKPANEPIVLARKPLEKGLSIAENVLKWGVGAINIDGCRVGFKNEADYKESTQKNQHEDFGTKPLTNNNVYGDYSMIQPKNYEPTGRFPANLILTHHPECECVGTKNDNTPNGEKCGFADENGEETTEDWKCHDDCPIKILDEQSGILNQQGLCKTDDKSGWQNNYVGGGGVNSVKRKLYLDKGGASRFFYVAKASKSERNKGLDGFEEKEPQHDFGTDFGESRETRTHTMTKNFHPTVKPIKLMQYLVRLITPPNGIVLDPFCGSGTTGVACKLEGFEFVGIEQDIEYCKIAQSRIDNYFDNKEKESNKSNDDNKSNGLQQASLF